MDNQETTREMIRTFLRLAKENSRKSPKETLEYAHKALKLSIELGDEVLLALSYQWKGIGFYATDEYEKAIKHFLKSLEISEPHELMSCTANNLSNIGVVYAAIRNYEDALTYYRRSLEIREQTGDMKGIASSLTKMGNIYSRVEKYEEAIEYHQKALDILEDMNDTMGMGLVTHNIGIIYQKSGFYAQAIDFFNKSLVLRRRCNDRIGEAKSLTILAESLLGSGETVDATKYCDQAIELLIDLNNKQGLVDAYRVKAKIAAHNRDFEEAYKIQVKYIEVSEDLYNIRSATRISDLKNLLESDKQKREIEVLKKDMEIVQLEKRNTALAMAVTANHELNQPLMILRGNLDMLIMSVENDSITEAQKKYIEKINHSLSRIQKILEKFREFNDIRFENYSEGAPMIVFNDIDEEK